MTQPIGWPRFGLRSTPGTVTLVNFLGASSSFLSPHSPRHLKIRGAAEERRALSRSYIWPPADPGQQPGFSHGGPSSSKTLGNMKVPGDIDNAAPRPHRRAILISAPTSKYRKNTCFLSTRPHSPHHYRYLNGIGGCAAADPL